MTKKAVKTTDAPKAIGPYNQAIVANGMVFCSGQIPIDIFSGGLIPGGVAKQTEAVLNSLAAVLKEAGSSMDKIVKTTVYLKDMNDFATMNEEYAKFFPENPPARATVEVSRLPKDVSVEIDCIAIL